MTTTQPARTSGGLSTWFGRNPFQSLREEMNDLFSRFTGEGDGGWMSRELVPSLDLTESNGNFEIKMDLPGFRKDEIALEVTGNAVRISGEHKEEKEEKDKRYHRIERRAGSFSRSLSLPCAIKEDKVTAECHEGVLTVTLPKTEEAKTHKVSIKG